MSADTIAAVATAQGRGAVGIVRLSGPDATRIATHIAGTLPPARHAGLREFRDAQGEVCDQGLALVFPAPNSYTGEDVVELQAHGGPVVLSMLLQHAVKQGARQAMPGEFSERAFLNDRLDLAQAEAVADLIDAASESAVRAARRTLAGAFSNTVQTLETQLMDLRVFVESALDFSDEDIDWLADTALAEKIQQARGDLESLQNKAHQGRRLRDGIQVVIVGKPNAGKSTLINALAAFDAAIISEQAGTTRDVLREQILIDDVPLTIIDTAGLRESDDEIEQEGIRRAWNAVEQADVALYLIDDRREPDAEDQSWIERIAARCETRVLLTQCDRSAREPTALEFHQIPALRLSAKSGQGMDLLRSELLRCAGLETDVEGAYGARERHLRALDETRVALERAAEILQSGQTAELAAEELRRAQESLGEIHGRSSTEDLLGAVFSRFCIGK